MPRGDLEGLLDLRAAEVTLADVTLPATVSERLDSMLLQQRKRDWLREHGKVPIRKLLFVVPPPPDRARPWKMPSTCFGRKVLACPQRWLPAARSSPS